MRLNYKISEKKLGVNMAKPQPLFTIYEADCSSFSFETANTPCPACIQAFGYGSNDCQQKCASYNSSQAGPWFEEIVNFGNCFEDGNHFQSLVDAEYASRQTDLSYKLSGKFDFCPSPGDYLNLVLKDDSIPKKLQVQKVTMKPNGVLMLELGKRKQDEVDAFNSASSLGQVYSTEYLLNVGTIITSSHDIQIDKDVISTPYFTVPDWTESAPFRMTLDISSTLQPGVLPRECTLAVTMVQFDKPVVLCMLPHYIPGTSVVGMDIKKFFWGLPPIQLRRFMFTIYCAVNGTTWDVSKARSPPKMKLGVSVNILRRNIK